MHIPYETDLRLVGDQLLSTVLAHPELAHTPGAQPLLHATPLLAPPTVSLFVGREQAIKALRQCFQADRAYILAPPITGPGGIGKTQLTLKVVRQQVEEAQYAYVFWIPAESEQKLLDAYLRMADGLGIYVDKENLQQAVQTIRAYLKDQHCLYVFDDAPDIAAIQGFLPLAQGHVLITSRNSSVGAWSTKPLLMNPFSEEEALALAQEFGYGQSREEQEALKALLAKGPRYPLTLVQLFSTLEAEGYQAAGWLTAMEHYAATAQEQTLITLLNERPHARVGYAQSMVYVLKTSLERLAKEQQGVKALQLISQLAYLDPKGIPLEWLLTWDTQDTSPFKRQTRAALSLLEKYSLIQWDRPAQQVYIHAETQLVVRYLYPQPSLTGLISRLVDYVGDEEQASQNAARWTSLLPHGKVLFERLNTSHYSEEAYLLTRYLVKACEAACLFEEGVSWSQQQLQIAQKCYPKEDHPKVAIALSKVGYSLRNLGNYQESIVYLKETLAMHRRLYKNQDHPTVARSLQNVGWNLEELGEFQKTLAHFKEALDIYKRIYKDTYQPEIAHSLHSVGWSLGRLGKHQEALCYLQEALAMRKRIYKDSDHPSIALVLDDLGRSLILLGRNQEALIYARQALGMYQRLYEGQDHPKVARALNGVGWCLGELGRYQDELECYKQSLSIRKRLYKDKDHPEVARSLHNVGWSLGKSGNYQEALDYFKKALGMHKRIYQNEDHPFMALALDFSSFSLRKIGKYQEALTYLKKALVVYKHSYRGQDHPDIARALNNLGATLSESGDYQKGLQYSQEALVMYKRIYKDAAHPWVAETLNSLGESFLELGQLSEALPSYKQAICMALRVYQQEHPHITQYLNNLISTLNKLDDQTLIQQTKDEVVPLCTQWLGAKHALTQQLRDAGT